MSNRPHTRVANPLMTFPAARRALLELRSIARDAGLSDGTRLLVEIRASQLNRCAVCLDMHTRELRAAGESHARIDTIAAWRETPYFTDSERAALDLAEAVTRLGDQPVPDELRAAAAQHFTEPELAALIISIATINAFNRIMIAAGHISGDWVEKIIEQDEP